MTEVPYSSKIKPEHLARKAIVYLRQSSEKQVRQNKKVRTFSMPWPNESCSGLEAGGDHHSDLDRARHRGRSVGRIPSAFSVRWL